MQKKVVSLILMIVLLFSQISFAVAAGEKSDITGHWAKEEISSWITQGFVNGFSDGSFKPDQEITRAEFMAFVNRMFGFAEKAKLNFSDVSSDSTDWYVDDIAIAVAAGYINGYQDGTIRPNATITRQEVAAIVARLLHLKSDADHERFSNFKDADRIAGWSKADIQAVVEKGYMNGFPDKTFQPTRNISRAQAIVTLDRTLKDKFVMYSKEGTYGPAQGTETINRDVMISVAGVTLQNTIINGNLLLGVGIGEGDVHLNGVTVKGKTTVKGGGENSIHVINSELFTVIVDKQNGMVRIVTSGSTSIEHTTLQSGAKLEEQDRNGTGFKNVAVKISDNGQVVLSGDFQNVQIDAPNVHVSLESGSIKQSFVNENATGTSIDIHKDAFISELRLDAASNVSGVGSISKAIINSNGSVIAQKPKEIQIKTGVSVRVAGSTVTESKVATTPTVPPATVNPSTPTAPSTGGGNHPSPIAVSAIKVNPTTITLTIGASETITATVEPANATNKNVIWSSSDDQIATVANGVVTAMSAGTATITATSAADSTKTATTIVTVSSTAFSVTSDAFVDGGAIPIQYSRYADNEAIPLRWNLVDGATNYGLLMYDIDAEDPVAGPFIHWAVTGITNENGTPDFSNATEYTNWFGEQGYGGPQPPPGENHTYVIEVYAIDGSMNLEDEPWGITKADFEDALDGYIVDTAQIIGTFIIEPILASWEATGNIEVKDDLYYAPTLAKEYRLLAENEVIDLSANHIKNIYLFGQISEPNYSSTLWVPIELPSNVYNFIIVTKDNDLYEATLVWNKPSEAEVTFSGPTGAANVFTDELGRASIDFSNVTVDTLSVIGDVYGIELTIEGINSGNVKKAFHVYDNGFIEELFTSNNYNTLEVTTNWMTGLNTIYYVLTDHSIHVVVIDVINLTPQDTVTIINAIAHDLNDDGILDSILVQASQAIKDNSVKPELFLINGVPATNFVSGNYPNDEWFWIDIDPSIEINNPLILTVSAGAFEDQNGLSNIFQKIYIMDNKNLEL